MVSRKHRTAVVLDTNVFVRAFKTRSSTNFNRRIVRLWLVQKELQLILSRELISEYLGIFSTVLEMDEEIVCGWRERFESHDRSTVVNLGRRYTSSRDPDDNLLLDTAAAGRASFLITNDRDLLELPKAFRRTLPFSVVTPGEFINSIDQD
jgi:putative PIN family toxin of toxin-antitoxin system